MTEPADLPGRLRALWQAPDSAPVLQVDGAWVSWGTVRALADEITRSLDGLGLGRGARVGVLLGNWPESIAAILAILGTERCLTVFNPLQPAERLAGDLERATPPVMIVPVRAWASSGLAEPVERLGISLLHTSPEGIAVVRAGRADAAVTAVDAPGVAVELTTSGTTGPPKRIPLTYRQLEASVGSARGHMKPGGGERSWFEGGVAIVSVPLVHIGGLWGALQALSDARRIVLLERWTLDRWLDVIREHRPRLGALPPAALRTLMNADVPAEDLASLRALTCGTAPVSPDLVDAVLERYGIHVLGVYGATEFSGAVAGWSLPDHRQWWAKKRGSVGRAFPGVGLRVVAEDGKVLPTGSSGLLEIRTDQAGARANADGWTRTSDLAHLDDDGFLYIEGRADDVIIRGGFKIRPLTVREVLEEHPAVAEAAVFGLPDERLGQVPVAVVELAPGAGPIGEQELRDWCRPRMLPYEVPARALTVPELPRGVSQKVSMPDLLALFAEQGDDRGTRDLRV
ncbi:MULTISPECIES: class I adenylate-forming enzyme family protein [Frankia]|uniref:O-succinylbenzoate--CoA ligase (OSB-CoA synthetase) (O-succinylbenzoyl-CoA synthetase) n=1 Tax=Frankia alni (strain DSM 45986 / CECT 9034 / ACN14a) TaxID=326424 RepID=Q0RG77_FRAAA|nr:MULTISPECIES: fatty acid--CoA ligase family protein [Frankia]CAJ63512.1 putative O-succinylbenzoate--CoA ligase (OSB-CoA synthetase) (O-succinylbenzoyl-CoA synthetase) [Frankia alni ACN14a]